MDSITKAVERARQDKLTGARSSHDGVQADMRSGIRKVVVSMERMRENRITTGSHDEGFAQAYKVLRTRVWQSMRANGWTTLAITSAKPGEGKTLTAINLAISLSLMEINHTVILADLDMRRPCMHKYFGLNPGYGIADYLVGGMPLDDVMLAPGIGKLMLIPGNGSLMNSSEILSSARMVRFHQELKARFPSRIIIVDLPPLLVTDDVLAITPSVDAFLLVIEEGKSLASDVEKSVELLKDARLIGTVLNKSRESIGNYGLSY